VSAALGQRATWMRHFVLAALCAATTINYVQRNSLGGVEKLIRDDLHLDLDQTGAAAGMFFLVYALCQIPSGWLAQRITPRRALSLYALGWSLATALLALTAGAATLIGTRALMGAFQAGIFPCATMILLVWYPSKRRALASAILNSFMMIGTAVGSMLTSVLVGPVGWRGLFVLYAVPGVVWAVWFAWWFRNRPSEDPSVNPAEMALLDGDPPLAKHLAVAPASDLVAAPSPRIILRPWLAIFLSWPLFLICVQQFCRAGSSRFFDQWFVTYLREARGREVAEANMLASWPQWAGVVGGVVGGWASDAVLQATGSRRAGRKGVAIASLLGCLVCYAAAYRTPNVYAATALASAGMFVAMCAAPCAYALTMDMGGRNLALVFGAMNMAGNFGAMAFAWFSPLLKKWSGDWTLPVMAFAGVHVVAAGCWLLLNPDGQIGEPAATNGVLPKATDEVDGTKRGL
jgi:MFS family permease